MSRPIAFPRGVATSDGSRAYLGVRREALVALDLNTGRVEWCATQALRPLIATQDGIVALRARGGKSLSLVVLDPGGATICESAELPVPDWIDPWSEDFALDTSSEGDTVLIDWSARTHYRGGAAPSVKIVNEAAREAAGRWRFNRRTCAVEVETRSRSAASCDAESPAQASDTAPLLPDVLEQQRIENRLYQLALRRLEGHRAQTVMRALDARTGECLWESVIDEGGSQKAAPLRQSPPTSRR